MPKFVLPTVRDNLAAGRSVELGAAMCAAWALGCEGRAEDGSQIVVDDQQGEALVAAAARQKSTSATSVLHGLGGSPVRLDRGTSWRSTGSGGSVAISLTAGVTPG